MKIYNLSHYDLDGFGCQLCIHEKFKNNIIFNNCSYSNIKNEINKISFDDYDLIFVTDLNFNESEQKLLYEKLKTYKGKFIYIDHHIYETTEYLDKIKNELNHKIIIDISKSASMKTYEILKLNNENLFNLIKIIDIYDVLREDNPKFKLANYINDYFWEISDEFREKMIKQNYKFSNEDKEKIKSYKNYVKEYIKDNIKKGIIINTPKLVISFDYKYSNHYDEFFDKSVLICNIKNKKFSIRLKNEFDSEKMREYIVEIVKEVFNPYTFGGHSSALGFEVKELNNNKLKLILSVLSNFFNKGITLEDIPF